jgi:glycosyltransferase involved in cell wall biosynthesis
MSDSPNQFSQQFAKTQSELGDAHHAIRQILEKHKDLAEESISKIHKLRSRDLTIAYLQNEIAKLRHGYNHLEQTIAHLHKRLKNPSCPDNPPELETLRTGWVDIDRSEEPFFGKLDVPDSSLLIADDQVIRVGGWCLDRKGRAAEHVWVRRGDVQTPCKLGWPRPDVKEEFASLFQADLNCGFNVLFAADKGVNEIEILAQFPESDEVFTMFKRAIVRIGKAEKGQLEQDYRSWVQLHDTISAELEAQMAEVIRTWTSRPRISILLPTYNTDARLLCEAIESVRKQIYSNWELCIADDASPAPHVRKILEDYARKDARIKVVIREHNGHISAATNSALELATGDYCALLDHDDILPRHALFHVAELIVHDPETTLIFSDEDKIDEDGIRFDPYFKSDWNLELFLSHNCVSHLGVYKTAILREIHGFQEDLFGSQDWDLAFRFIAHAGESGIRHIPKILYHWRYLDSSTAKSIDCKPYAIEAGKRAIEGYLRNKGVEATVRQGFWGGAFQVKYHLKSACKASLVLFGDAESLSMAAATIMAATDYPYFELLCGVNGERNDIGFPADERIRVFPVQSANQSNAYQILSERATGDVLVFLDASCQFPHSAWLEELVSHAMLSHIGAVGPWLVSSDGRTVGNGIVFGERLKTWTPAFKGLPIRDIGHMGRAHLAQRYSALRGECLATRREIFRSVGGFDPDRFPNAIWAMDYCLTIQKTAGLHALFTPNVQVLLAAESQALFEHSGKEYNRFVEKWQDQFERDPYFNPNLNPNDPRFFMQWPKRGNV